MSGWESTTGSEASSTWQVKMATCKYCKIEKTLIFKILLVYILTGGKKTTS